MPEIYMNRLEDISDPTVKEEDFYEWYKKKADTPLTWIKIELNGKPITGQTRYKFQKDFNVLCSPPYDNLRQVDENKSYNISPTNSYAYVIDPMNVAFLSMESPNLIQGVDEIFLEQQGQKKPEVKITFQTTDMPKDDAVNVIDEAICENCVFLGRKIIQELIHLRFGFAQITKKKTRDTGNIVTSMKNWNTASA